MEKTIRDLLMILDVLIGQHKELLGVEQQKLNAIVNQDWKGLEVYLSHSRDILKKIENTEHVRLDTLERLCGRKDATLSDLKLSIPAGMHEELDNSSTSLIALIKEQKVLNENIEKLLKNSLEIVDFSISLFSRMGSKGSTYSVNGKESPSGKKISSFVFDVKA
jgi:DNA-binding Xre family transcriptional regulator